MIRLAGWIGRPRAGRERTMLIRNIFIVGLLVVYAGSASANSCSNVTIMGSFDESGLRESDYGIYATGTFRIQNEGDESKQPMLNLATVNCEKQIDDPGKAPLECKLTKAVVWASADNPNTATPNCLLDLDSSTYSMRELQKGILAGVDESTSCFQSMLTIDRNTKRVYLSFTRTKYADNYDRIKSGTCATAPRTQVLMNCTPWAASRKKTGAPRYCDFSSSSDK
jgi:hypothetical protein